MSDLEEEGAEEELNALEALETEEPVECVSDNDQDDADAQLDEDDFKNQWELVLIKKDGLL